MRRIEIFDRAQSRLAEIHEWTHGRFGPAQTARYLDLMQTRFAEIASDLAHSRDLAAIAGLAASTDFRVARSGEHFVVFRIDAETVQVLDILHSRSDLPRHAYVLLQDLKDTP